MKLGGVRLQFVLCLLWLTAAGVYDEIKRLQPQTRVLMMSGYTDDALAHHGVLDEGLSFLEKPFSPIGLARKVREVLDAPVFATARKTGV